MLFICYLFTNLVNVQKAVLMVLLDLSAAFDVIDHDVMLKRLEVTCGLKGTVLKWMESYLRGRSQKVYFGRDSSSDPVSLSYALPQGSGLGPIKFAIYVIPLGVIIRRYEIDYHMYADDNQIYLAFDLGDKEISAAIAKMERCVAEIRVWMRNNMLKLNDDKTEVVMFSSPQHKACLKDQVLNIGSVQISPAPGARNLGVQMDQLLNMRDQVNSIYRSSYIQLCYLRSHSEENDTRVTGQGCPCLHYFTFGLLQFFTRGLASMPNCKTAANTEYSFQNCDKLGKI